MADFKAVFYAARCAIEHHDPYDSNEFLRIYRTENGEFPADPALARLFLRAVPICVNLPTSLLLLAPLALLPWGLASALWMILTSGSIFLAGVLTWSLTREYPSVISLVSLVLVCLVLANSELLVSGGNLSGIAIGLCVAAVWCFTRKRFVSAGIVCLALALVTKPQDAGFVWLYFLLADGAGRKRALKSLALTAVLGMVAAMWISSVSPHWFNEFRSNIKTASAHGDLNDPGPASLSTRDPGMIIDLQTLISLFEDDPRAYNALTYLIVGVPILVWVIVSVRSRVAGHRGWLALASIIPLSLLLVYHRLYDAKLLLLTIPACAMLWAEGHRLRRLALVLTGVAVTITGDLVAAVLHMAITDLPQSQMTPWMAVVARPVPVVLFAMGVLYLYLYAQHLPSGGVGSSNSTAMRASATQLFSQG